MQTFLPNLHKVTCRLKTRHFWIIFRCLANQSSAESNHTSCFCAVCSFKNHKPVLENKISPSALSAPEQEREASDKLTCSRTQNPLNFSFICELGGTQCTGEIQEPCDTWGLCSKLREDVVCFLHGLWWAMIVPFLLESGMGRIGGIDRALWQGTVREALRF